MVSACSGIAAHLRDLPWGQADERVEQLAPGLLRPIATPLPLHLPALAPEATAPVSDTSRFSPCDIRAGILAQRLLGVQKGTYQLARGLGQMVGRIRVS